jgi:glyoxylase-like metal-dependent hydrolase (beta-lactamase superfamily II)
MRWMVGDIKVSLVRELMIFNQPEQIYEGHDPAVFAANADWLAPFMNDEGLMGFSVHALVLEIGEQVVLVDPCIGCHQTPIHERVMPEDATFLPDLEAAGYKPEDIDLVVCTHLHYDHVGWNTRWLDGKWVPTFPNARYLFSKADFDYWDSGAEGAAWTFDDAVRPVVAAGQADLVEMDHRVSENLWLEPSPGHSPGHVTIHIASRGEHAVISGDTIHHPVQCAAPHWKMAFDVNPAMAVETRNRILSEVADKPVRFFGTHFPDPSSGFIISSGDAYMLSDKPDGG